MCGCKLCAARRKIEQAIDLIATPEGNLDAGNIYINREIDEAVEQLSSLTCLLRHRGSEEKQCNDVN